MRSWMKVIVPAIVNLGGLSANANAAGPGHDYPPFVTIQGYQRTDFLEDRFDKAVFLSDDNGTKTTVAGYLIQAIYRLRDPTYGGDPYLYSSLQEQVKAIQGAQILNQTDRCTGSGGAEPYNASLTVRFQKGNTPVWVAVSCLSSFGYGVTVVEEQAFHQ